MVLGWTLEAGGDNAVSILRLAAPRSAPVASPALVKDGHAPVSPNVSIVAGGTGCLKSLLQCSSTAFK